jgi:hypothetical protein
VHCEPYAQLKLERLWQDALKIRGTPRQRHLADANAKACANCHELRNVAISPEGEANLFNPPHALAHTADLWRFPIEADQTVVLKAVETTRSSYAIEIAPVGMQTKRDSADALDHQRLVRWLNHAHGNIGIRPQQIVYAVGQYEFNLKLRIVFTQCHENRGKHFGADDLARSDTNMAAVAAATASA